MVGLCKDTRSLARLAKDLLGFLPEEQEGCHVYNKG